MSFAEIFASDIADLRITPESAARGLVPINVTPDEIADLTTEMLDRLESRAAYTREDEAKQERFRGYLREGHYAFGTGSRIGRDCLRAHMPETGTAALAGAVHRAIDG